MTRNVVEIVAELFLDVILIYEGGHVSTFSVAVSMGMHSFMRRLFIQLAAGLSCWPEFRIRTTTGPGHSHLLLSQTSIATGLGYNLCACVL